jgi:hypothetical protein
LLNIRYLVYFNPDKVLYLKINKSLARGFAVMLFYFKIGYIALSNLFKIALIAIKLILFFSKLLSLIKKNYCFIKLEVACLIYICRRLKVIL